MPRPSTAPTRLPLDAVVVGAGITGLTAAFRLVRSGARVALLEASDRVGGAIETWRPAEAPGFLFELGPNTVLDGRPEVGELIADAGLSAERLAADRTAARRYLWKGERLLPLPAGPASFLSTQLFSFSAKLRLLREPWIAPAAADTEESIATFVRRRLGPELLDYAVGPFVSGVYAGDPERLSARWAVAKIWALERDHGSLIRGALAKRKGPAPRGAMISFRDGLDALPRRLAEVVGVAEDGATGPGLHLATPCRRVLPGPAGGLTVETVDGRVFDAPRAILALPADATAAVLEEATRGESSAFAEVPYAPVATVALGFRRADVAHPLDGFGFLAPRRESLRILGSLFPSTLFPGRAPAGHVALAAFAGGRTDPELVTWDDERILATVLADLDRALGLAGASVVARVRRWPRAIPQYEVDHGRFVELTARIEAALPGLTLAGNATGGVSVPDCIARGAAVAR